MRATLDFRSAAIKHIRDCGIEGLDGPWAPQTQELSRKFRTSGYALNRLWLLTPPDWICPCCARSKPELARQNQHQELMGVLVEHHDHSDQLIEVILLNQARNCSNIKKGNLAGAFIKRGATLLRAYDPIVLCQDCNNADPNAKRLVGAPRHFSFSPLHISRFIRTRPGVGHEINSAAAQDVWQEAEILYRRRVALIKWLAQVALENKHWLVGKSKSDDLESIERHAQNLIDRIIPFIEIARVDDYITAVSPKTPRATLKKPRRWSSRRRLATLDNHPTDGDVAAVAEISHAAIWQSFAPEWSCPCCSRSKRDCIMRSGKFSWAFSAQSWAQEGPTINVCGECKSIASELAKEASIEVRNVIPQDVKNVIDHVRPNSYHFARGDEEIDSVVSAIIARVHSTKSP